MATDNTEPRTGLILRLGALAVVTLVVVHAGLSAYYDRMAKAEELRKLGVPEALVNLHADEKTRLGSGAMPIDKAMQMLADKGRMGTGPAIAPTVSKDVAPLQGWSKMPGEVPAAMTAAPPPAVEPVADGGIAVPDGAAPASGKPDGGPAAGTKGHPAHK